MKIRLNPALGFAAILAAGFGPLASASIFSDKIDTLIIAEHPPGAPASTGPISFIAFDGGYIEAGDPIAGDTPPTPQQVEQSVHAALLSQGFRAAAGTPSVVLTYHWGVLRVDHREIRIPYGIKPNLEARIDLVSTQQMGDEVKNHILIGKKGSGLNSDAASPAILVGPLETIRQDSRQPRIFIVISAYDYQSLAHREAKLLWRVKLSTQEQSGEMNDVIPAMIAGGAPYFGKNLPGLKDIDVSPAGNLMASGSNDYNPNPESYQLDKGFIADLLRSEHSRISGVTDEHGQGN
jgi:hypothetical protein